MSFFSHFPFFNFTFFTTIFFVAFLILQKEKEKLGGEKYG